MEGVVLVQYHTQAFKQMVWLKVVLYIYLPPHYGQPSALHTDSSAAITGSCINHDMFLLSKHVSPKQWDSWF